MFGLRRGQLFGIALGAALGAIVSVLARVQGSELALNDGIFWGAVIGGILSAIPQFARSGAVLTRSTHSGLNLAVGLLGSLIFVVVVGALAILLARLFF